jgi:glycosyltransferase involved in cell wall biosynthesis
MRSIDIFVLPSLSEASSNSLMEAMGCGCCPVASRVGGNPELIRDGHTGLLFEKGNPVSLAEALERLLANSEERTRMTQAAMQDTANRFSLSASTHRMQEIYLKHLQRKFAP